MLDSLSPAVTNAIYSFVVCFLIILLTNFAIRYSSGNSIPTNTKIESDKKIDRKNKTTKATENTNNMSSSVTKISRYGHNLLMKLQSNLSTNSLLTLPPKMVVITDLDFTLIGKGNDETFEQALSNLKKFEKLWLTSYAPQQCILVYATGRNLAKYELAVEEWQLMRPDILVTNDGVHIHWFNERLTQSAMKYTDLELLENENKADEDFMWADDPWTNSLSDGWNQALAEEIFMEFKNAHGCEELPIGSLHFDEFRVAAYVKGEHLAKIAQQLFELRVKEYNSENRNKPLFVPMEIHTFHCRERYVDDCWWSAMTPLKAGKGCAVEWIRTKLHLTSDMDKSKLIAVGDSGNDISMLDVDGICSVIVSNASNELLSYFENHGNPNMILTKNERALGVIEGLQYFGSKILQNKD